MLSLINLNVSSYNKFPIGNIYLKGSIRQRGKEYLSYIGLLPKWPQWPQQGKFRARTLLIPSCYKYLWTEPEFEICFYAFLLFFMLLLLLLHSNKLKQPFWKKKWEIKEKFMVQWRRRGLYKSSSPHEVKFDFLFSESVSSGIARELLPVINHL